jgi:hypothetical protein
MKWTLIWLSSRHSRKHVSVVLEALGLWGSFELRREYSIGAFDKAHDDWVGRDGKCTAQECYVQDMTR